VGISAFLPRWGSKMFSYYELESERQRTSRESARADAERRRADYALSRANRAEEDAAAAALGGIILGSMGGALVGGTLGYLLGKK
jgi:hypothetical protein